MNSRILSHAPDFIYAYYVHEPPALVFQNAFNLEVAVL